MNELDKMLAQMRADIEEMESTLITLKKRSRELDDNIYNLERRIANV
jgi:septal ring factor EnvC (AmiA/AmiB activator)